MSYENPFSIGYEILKAESPSYSIHSHGDIGATYNSMANADLPEYTARFYSHGQHEQFSSIRYNKIEIGYEEGLREIHEAISGIPLEGYVPRSIVVPQGGVFLPRLRTVGEDDGIVDASQDLVKAEIEGAHRDAINARLVDEIIVEEIILRRIRRRVFVEKIRR